MRGKTISFSKGKGSINHNNRKFLTDNIDKNRVQNNITYKSQKLEAAYEEIFGEALKEYNAKQKRNDRKIENYITHLKNSKNKEQIFHEVIVQVGDLEDSGYGTKDFEICSEVLDQYMKNFENRNPHLHVFNANLHLDESTPHLHISFIPIAKGYKQGLSVRNSITKSMNDFFGEKHATNKFYEVERNEISKIARDYDIKIIQKNEERPHLRLSEYRTAKDGVKTLTEELTTLETSKNTLKNEINIEEEIKYNLESEIKALQGDLLTVEGFTTEHTPKTVLGHVSAQEYLGLKQAALKYSTESSKLKLELQEKNEKLKALEERSSYFKRENDYLRVKNCDLKKSVSDLESQVDELEDQVGVYDVFVQAMGLSEKLETHKEFFYSVVRVIRKPFEFSWEQYKTIKQKLEDNFKIGLELDEEDKSKLKKDEFQSNDLEL